MIKTNRLFTVAFLFLFSLILLFYQSDKPFWGHHDFNNAFYGNMARNLLRYSITDTKLGQVTNSGFVTPPELTFHTHHPPLLIWLLAISYFLFGVSETATRIVPILFSAGTVVLFYLLLKKLYSTRVALTASIFWVMTPLFLYFGKMAVQEILVLFFAVFCLYSFVLKRRLLLFLTVLGATLSGWPGYYMASILTVAIIAGKANFKRSDGFILLGVCLAIVGLHFSQVYILTGNVFGGGLGESFLLRSSSVPLLAYVHQEISWVTAYFTKPLILLGLTGIVLSLWRRDRTVLILLAFGLSHLVLFPQAAFRHDYLIYYLLPLIPLGAAMTIETISKVKYVSIIFLAIVAVLVLASGYNFTRALLESSYDRDGVNAGQLIREKTKPGANVLLVDPKIKDNSEWQVIFYSDRKVRIVPTFPTSLLGYDKVVTKNSSESFEIQP